MGGQGVGVFPKNAYGTLLEALVDAGEFLISGVGRALVPETKNLFWI